MGNTPRICLHPAVIESYPDGTLLHTLQQRAQEELIHDVHALWPEEAAVLALLQERLQTEEFGSKQRKKYSR